MYEDKEAGAAWRANVSSFDRCWPTHGPPTVPVIVPGRVRVRGADADPTGMWVSEKLDGVRAVFVDGVLRSRSGRIIRAPEWFTRALPSAPPLDGELYTRRGDFSGVMAAVARRVPRDAEWRRIRYHVFDVPVADVPLEDRYAALRRAVAGARAPHLRLVPLSRVRGPAELEAMHAGVRRRGGEGLILRVPGSRYEAGRSRSLWKVKRFDDAEAVVVGHRPGRGRNADRLGRLIARWHGAGGGRTVTFGIGSGFTDDQRRLHRTLFPPGTVVTVRHHGRTSSGRPRFPVFHGVRHRIDRDALLSVAYNQTIK